MTIKFSYQESVHSAIVFLRSFNYSLVYNVYFEDNHLSKQYGYPYTIPFEGLAEGEYERDDIKCSLAEALK